MGRFCSSVGKMYVGQSSEEKNENKESTCTEEHWEPLPVLLQIVWELTT